MTPTEEMKKSAVQNAPKRIERTALTLREQAAIAAMQGVMNFFGSIDYNREEIARLAVEQADALIKELNKD